ncbi:cation diffusion facilitator family transporter [Sphingomonas trueperi]|uniref:Cation diffusion facilitator family transporter n=1 Tax=Sphingomonas trueperi TaxID=53317 RepID=A0A7X6BCJ2_9SPHN|nr:cation diffusion facilitator family transporter [Sphingomonas trueperi]
MHVDFGTATWIAVLGLLVNLASALLLSGGHHHHHHHDHGHAHGHDHHGHNHDNNLRAAYVHVLADALTSILAIAALLAGRYLGWSWMDAAVGLVGAVVIACWSWSLLRDTAAMLLDATDDHVAEEVRALVEAPGDARIVDLHVWRVGPEARAAIVSVTGVSDTALVRRRLAPVHELAHLTIETR